MDDSYNDNYYGTSREKVLEKIGDGYEFNKKYCQYRYGCFD